MALEHRLHEYLDKDHLRYERPWYPLLFDREERHWKDRHYYLVSELTRSKCSLCSWGLPISTIKFRQRVPAGIDTIARLTSPQEN